MHYWGYDLETMPNFFSAVFVNKDTGERFIFEISDWIDQAQKLSDFLYARIADGSAFIGYNNVGFDYPIIHQFLNLVSVGSRPTAMDMYLKCCAIIESSDRWAHMVWESDMHIPQIDLYKICHFDNFARATSLKKLEVAMRSVHVEVMPVAPGDYMQEHQRKGMIWYNCYDVAETLKFAGEIWDRIDFRAELDAKYGGKTRMNFNDTKIGKNHFLDVLTKSGIRVKEGSNPIQTPRYMGVKVSEVLLPMAFDNPTLQAMYEFMHSSTIPAQQTKGFFTDLSAYARDFKLDFGTGGLHGSVHKQTTYSDDTHVIMDCDVTSYYPSIAIKHGFYPEHLGNQFCQIYADLLAERQSHAKGTAPNAMLKLALNGTYGESNNKYSSFYDPQFTMAITLNGQLLLAKLMEMLLHNPAAEPIQANTDGLTIRLPRVHMDWYHQVCDAWQAWSLMDLEYAEYRSMHIRDVNNYIAVGSDGKAKTKGAYNPKPDWHQDHSALVVQKAVLARVEDGLTPDHYIYKEATDPYDFMLSVKCPRGSRLDWGGEIMSSVCRYYIALGGRPLTKIMPPLSGKTEEREIGIKKGWRVGVCNYAGDFDWSDLNRRWYLDEAETMLADLGL